MHSRYRKTSGELESSNDARQVVWFYADQVFFGNFDEPAAVSKLWKPQADI